MLLPKFDFHEPTSLEEACRIIAELGIRAKPLAGGTDLIVNMKKKLLSPEHLVSLSRIEALRSIAQTNGLIKIGAGCTVAELAENEEIKTKLSALSAGAIGLGTPLIRNLATIGGNLASARPAADLVPPLMAYKANVVLKTSSGERSVAVEDLLQGPGQTVIEPDEVLTDILIQNSQPYTGAGYIKLGPQKTFGISIVNVTAFISLTDINGSIRSARIILGAVGPTPILSHSAEEVLLGEKPTESLFVKVGEMAARDSRPIDDFRASAEYRRAMVEVLTRRVLNIACNEAKAYDSRRSA